MSEDKAIPTLEGSIEEVNAGLVEITKMETVIAKLEETYQKFVPIVDDPDGMKDAKAARLEIREPRYAIENLRKEAKRPILEAGRLLDDRANAMKARLLAIEEPIHNAIKNEEERAARERQAKIEAEAKRVEEIQNRIGSIKVMVEQAIYERAGSDRLRKQIDSLNAVKIDDSFAEFSERAQDAKDATLRKLEELLEQAEQREAEERKIAEERKELERLRAEAEERERKEQEAQAKREAEERAKREAEEAERRAKETAEREKLEREQETLREEQEKLRKAQEAEAKRQAELRAKEEREAEERRLAAEEAKKAEFPGKTKIIAGLAEHFGVSKAVATKWYAAIAASGR